MTKSSQKHNKALSVSGLSKKFTKDVTLNMLYGTQDLLASSKKKNVLRKNEFWALKDINVDFYKGETCAIIGANGSGKTTLIRVLSGIYDHSLGSVETYGNSITPVFAVKAGLNPIMSGLDNIHLVSSLYGLSKASVEEKLDYILDFSELRHEIQKPVGNYSSGMKARLGYTIAVATDPDVFIVDEALAVGDIRFRKKCFDQLADMSKKQNKAVLFVTNNNLKVEKVADRVIIMKEGRIIMDSTDIEKAMAFYDSDEYYTSLPSPQK